MLGVHLLLDQLEHAVVSRPEGAGSKDRLLSPKLAERHYGTLVLHEHWCPGCRMIHQIAVEQPFRNGARWSFDGNAEAPTFHPSVNVGPGSPRQCHYFLSQGRIQFLGDCHHDLAGQTVDLPDLPADEVDDLT